MFVIGVFDKSQRALCYLIRTFLILGFPYQKPVLAVGKHTWSLHLILEALFLSQTVWYQEPAAVQRTPVPALHDGHCCHDIRGVPHRAGPSAALQSLQPV